MEPKIVTPQAKMSRRFRGTDKMNKEKHSYGKYKSMDSHYTEVKSSMDSTIRWIYSLRQIFVCSGTWVVYFLCGLSFGIPTVMIPQLRREHGKDAVSDEMASWLSSVFGYSALPWVVIICLCTRKFGRKIPFAIVSINTFCYYCVLYFSVNTTQILISEIMQGMNHASNMTLSIIIVSEYTCPKYRGIFLAIKSATIFWGIWVANAIGTFFYWKYIPLLGIFLSIYSLTVVFWPESPQWLASKGKFEECKTSHRWLRGVNSEAEKELELLIQSQLYYKNRKNNVASIKNVKEKAFYKPLLLSMVMMAQYHLSGKLVCMVYSIDIIKKITDSESTAYLGMLILDGVTVAGMYTGCYLAKILKRRTLLFSSSSVAIISLFLISFYLLLIDRNVIIESKLVTISLLTFFSLSISCGPMILSTSIYGELIPLRFKSFCTMVSAIVFVCLTSTLLKIFPFICRTFTMSGAFFFYATSSLACFLVLFKYLPETKDMTLQEIENIFNDKKICEDTLKLGTA